MLVVQTDVIMNDAVMVFDTPDLEHLLPSLSRVVKLRDMGLSTRESGTTV